MAKSNPVLDIIKVLNKDAEMLEEDISDCERISNLLREIGDTLVKSNDMLVKSDNMLDSMRIESMDMITEIKTDLKDIKGTLLRNDLKDIRSTVDGLLNNIQKKGDS